MNDKIRIFVIENGVETEVTEWMYWFEENFIQDINGMRGYKIYGLRVEVNGETVFLKEEPK